MVDFYGMKMYFTICGAKCKIGLYMFLRPFWISKIEAAWRTRPLVWLSGVRRVGKTTMASMLPKTEYINCDLPSEVRGMADPELFLDKFPKGARIVLDEIHRLEDPARLLKIAADAYPHLRILATGSSTLAATKKFRDSLAGRKVSIHLPPVLWTECTHDAGIQDLGRRLLHGGLPQQLLSERHDPTFYSEWMDSFYARDVQELFSVRNRLGFIKCLRLLMRQSGGSLAMETVAAESEISRPTAISYLDALAMSHAVVVVRPYYHGDRREITRQPRCYAFDTGFICHERGWDTLRNEDFGGLWEHLVLDVLQAVFGEEKVLYWRDRDGHEVDFIVSRSRDSVTAIECKNNPDKFRPENLEVFRSACPQGENWVLSPAIKTAYKKNFGRLTVRYISLAGIFENKLNEL